jgi:nitroimidazol reductase NimA-like FMN-containing flavoprotein (pyridoxamine 5'-phosphate oxidase superfamily)
MPRLTPDERDTFLAEDGHLMRIATTDHTGMPIVVPIWFVAEEGRLWFTPRERSAWWACLQRDPRTCAVIDEEATPWRKVVIRGSVRIDYQPGEDDRWRDRYRRIACRYVSERSADAYLSNTKAERRALLSLPIDSLDVESSTWRMPVPGEDPRGVWADRYYQATPKTGQPTDH